jgi:pilus assembly protein CpaE
MTSKFIIAMEISDPRLGQSLLAALQTVPDVEIVKWQNRIAEKGILAVKTVPHVLLIQDQQEGGIFKRLSDLKSNLPQTEVFVLSDDKRPERIVDVMKAGATEYLVLPVDAKTLLDTLEEVRVKLATSGKLAKGPIFSFISSKGGLGATVLAVNIAVAIAKKKDTSAALCDLSFQSGDDAVLLDAAPENSVLDLCRNFHRLDVSLLRQVMTRHASGLELLAAPPSLVDADEIGVQHLEKTFSLLKKLYDYILVDCASISVDECTNEAFKASDKIFIVTDFSVNALRNGARLFQTIEKLGIPPRKIEFVANRFIKHDNLSIKEAEQALQKRIFWLFPNDFGNVIASINSGIPLVTSHPHSPLAKNIDQFIEKLRYPDKYDTYRGVKGAFGKDI